FSASPDDRSSSSRPRAHPPASPPAPAAPTRRTNRRSHMLLKLLGRYLRPHWRLLVGVVVFQLAQSLLSLWLPTLNADITDNGIAKGDTGYILMVGAEMLGVTLVQVACSIAAV